MITVAEEIKEMDDLKGKVIQGIGVAEKNLTYLYDTSPYEFIILNKSTVKQVLNVFKNTKGLLSSAFVFPPPSGAVITTDMLDYCSSVEKLQEKINEIINSPELKTSRIEKELHGKTPEEQYEFIYWLLFRFAAAYTDSRLAVVEWLKGGKGNG